MINIKKIATEYAGLVQKENKIKVDKKRLGLVMKEEMVKMGAKQFGIDKGIFTIHKLPTYTYSKALIKKLKEIEELKDNEVKKGIAKVNYSEFIWFKSNK